MNRLRALGPVPATDADSRTALEPMMRVLIHNDDVTPYAYVVAVLRTVFKLSEELAEHITWVAHTTGVACVVVRPRNEAQRLVDRAHMTARIDGYPLTFSLEPEG